DRLAARIPLEVPWTADRAEELDGQTFETWIRRNAVTGKARELLRLYAESVFAAQASDFSLLHALFYTHSGGGVDSPPARAAGRRGIDSWAGHSSYRSGSPSSSATACVSASRYGRSSRTVSASRSAATRSRSPLGASSSPSRLRWRGGSSTSRRFRVCGTSSPTACPLAP